MMERDGRPQGPTTPHPLPARPYYTTNWPAKPCIVGAGEDVDVGMGPWWLPVRAYHRLSSPYLACIGACPCPSVLRLFTWAHGAQAPHFGPDQGDQQDYQDGANASAGYGDDRAEELHYQAGLEATQFVGCADKDEIDGRNATKPSTSAEPVRS